MTATWQTCERKCGKRAPKYDIQSAWIVFSILAWPVGYFLFTFAETECHVVSCVQSQWAVTVHRLVWKFLSTIISKEQNHRTILLWTLCKFRSWKHTKIGVSVFYIKNFLKVKFYYFVLGLQLFFCICITENHFTLLK